MNRPVRPDDRRSRRPLPAMQHSVALAKAIAALLGVRGDMNAPAPPPHGFVLFPPNTQLGQLQRAFGVNRAQYDRDLP